jgi:hypothetical protein
VTDKGVVLDRLAFEDERVARDLAMPPDHRVPLDLHECPDSGPAADATAVEIHQVWMVNDDVLLEDDAWGNHVRVGGCLRAAKEQRDGHRNPRS